MTTRKLTALCLFLLLATSPVFASPSAKNKMIVRIPFEFMVGDKLLPAGEYKLTALPKKIYIRSMDGEHGLFALPKANINRQELSGTQAKMVFQVQQGRHHLSQVWMPADGIGRVIPLADTAPAGKYTVTLIAPAE